MTIEIADRLIKLRKQYGYSQEELADKLGLSRQAVSKWERAEASPDTDNLICLAKLYGISLDELLSTDEDLDTIVQEQVKKDEVHIEGDSIRLSDDEGNQVIITDKEVVCKDSDGNCVKRKDFRHPDKVINIINIIECVLGTLAIVAFILLGTLLGAWYNAWIVFFVPEIVCSIARAIHKKNANQFNMVFTATATFFFVCMVCPGLSANLWHPMWLVFLAIPLYHMIVSTINKLLNKNEEKEELIK